VVQCLLVSVFILLVSFGGDTASAFYNKLTLMANVSMTLPYLFLAFPFFKAKQDLDRPFVIFKTAARRCWRPAWWCWWWHSPISSPLFSR
jgi:amino acid transporter